MAIALSSTVLLGLRVAQAILAIIVLGTAGYVASWWGGSWRSFSPSEVNFLIFSAVWTLLALVYLTVVPLRFSNTVAHHKFAILGVEAVTMIFWFAGFIALAAWISGRVCYGTVCNSAKAATAFAAFEWLVFAVTTTFAALHTFSGRSSGTVHVAPTTTTTSTTAPVKETV